ncbi:MAG: ribulose-phosphate 3-epimerase [candidate division WOR-3 bacterium]|nr:ribulose-phosphate 3-epimerase [candidate division WOR-3 bacterium]
MKIAASILNCNFLNLGDEIKKIQLAGIDAIHLDVMDGHFVPNLSFGVPILKAIKPILKVPIISHLMVKEPEKMLEYFIPDSDGIIFHIEATNKPNQCLKLINDARKVTGIALNPDTPIEQVEPFLDLIDEILIMSVYPGFGGQTFIPGTITKIIKTKEMIKNKNMQIMIAVDGGVNLDNSKELISAGVDILITGTAIFHSKDYVETIRRFRCLK